jgi:hypothetical protein
MLSAPFLTLLPYNILFYSDLKIILKKFLLQIDSCLTADCGSGYRKANGLNAAETSV